MKLYCYDLETYVNCFLFIGQWEDSDTLDVFEISSRTNDRNSLIQFLNELSSSGATMIGYNNLNFDYPIIHELLNSPYTFDAHKAYHKAQEIISSHGFPTGVPVRDRLIPQIDLVKINHFDNKNKRTRLKDLQFAMRSDTVEDLPYNPHIALTSEQMDNLIAYGKHDVTETLKFAQICKPAIDMRRDLVQQGVIYGDVMNYSDVKIGVEYLISKIGRGKCFNGGKPIQSFRTAVAVREVILPKIKYRSEQYQYVLDWYKQQVIKIDSNEKPKLQYPIQGIDFHFGIGGVHASVDNKTYLSSPTHTIRDIDVSGMYVAVAISNGFYPEHLGQSFVAAYKQLQADRARYPKGTTMNAVLKLAGNGVYGNSNNPYSPFYDPKYTFSVTINGQLQLLQLVELLNAIPKLEIIQANTDGVTVYMPRDVSHLFDLWCREWESMTGLKLEEVEYSKMVIRDVNNYIAVTTDGKVKRKGAYWYPEKVKDYEGYWNKDYSAMIVQKAISQCLVNNQSIEAIIKCSTDPFDFMLRYKTPKGGKVYIGDTQVPNTCRYYISKSGQPMKKVADSKGEIGQYKRKTKISDSYYLKILSEIGKGVWDERIHTKNKSKYEMVVTSIQSGWKVKECNNIKDFDLSDVDYNYYIEEARKLYV